MWLREFDFLCMHGGRKNQSGEGEEGKDDDDDVDQWLNGVIDSHTTINHNYLGERQKAILDVPMSFQLMQRSYCLSQLTRWMVK
jgi:hypothetical protein